MISRVDSGVANLRSEGIELLVSGKHFVVLRPSILGKVMEMEHEGYAPFGKFGYDSRKMDIFAQDRVVEMPAGRFLAQGPGCDFKEFPGESGTFGFSVALIVERGDDRYRNPAGLLRRGPCQNDVRDPKLGESFGLSLDHSRHSTRTKVVVYQGD